MKRLGIALGGGGAKGFAHIGVLKTLEKHGIQPQIVAGTSVGALVGAVYACGKLEDLEQAATGISLTDIPLLLSPNFPFAGLFSGKNVLEMLNDLLTVKSIEELPKPYAAVAVDLKASEIVTHTSGDLRLAIRSSIAIPGVFTPVVSGQRVFVDGGLLEPIPVQAARALGAEVVIAVDLFGDPAQAPRSPVHQQLETGVKTALQYLHSIPGMKTLWKNSKAETDHELMNIVEVMERSLAIGQSALTKYRLQQFPADIVITPQVGLLGLLDFHRGAAAIEIAAELTETVIESIKQHLVP